MKKQGLHLTGEKSFSYASILLSFLALSIVLILAWYVFDKGDVKPDGAGPAKNAEGLNIDKASANNQQSEVVEVVQKVSKHIMLPQSDVTVVTVTDADLLRSRNPLYFQFVKNGDKIIRYALGLIVYDLEQDIIVDVIRLFPEQVVTGPGSKKTTE